MEARESLVALVDLNVLVQVSLLGEGQVAPWESALIRSLVGVNSKVVEEIVPFPEDFGTALMGTAE